MTRPGSSKRLLSLGRLAARAAQQAAQQPGATTRAPALAATASGWLGSSAVGGARVAATAPVASASAAAATAIIRPYAAQAQAVEVQQHATRNRTATLTIPEVRADLFGAVSPVDPAADAAAALAGASGQPYENADGKRHEDGRYARFADQIAAFIPAERVFTDPVRTFAYGTDASFYRLNPRMVVKVHSEAEVRKMLPIAKALGVPVTFRAAGTSLSGQAITDSVLIKLSHTGRNFRNYEIHGDGSSITVEPGLILGEVNRLLANHQRKGKFPVQYKMGPDPSSVDSCMVGGVVANNSSGMCCGVSQNTYHTLRDMRVMLVDGTVLDTADADSRAAFLRSHAGLVRGVVALAERVQGDAELSALIRRKFSIKCTTGYSLNALVDFSTEDPIEIIKHLMIGSEGTLGFVSRATYNTVPEWPHKASAFVVFPDVRSACRAAAVLRRETAVDAVELFDRPSLRECEADEAMTRLVPDIVGCDPMAAALLIECRGRDEKALEESCDEVNRALKRHDLPFGGRGDAPRPLETYAFSQDAKVCKTFWDVRKGLIPIVGAAREPGTSMLIEDVACPVDKLADMIVDLQDMFSRFGYGDASCFGHALEGNLHLVFAQGFRTKEEVQRFSDVMEEMCYIVATKHSGSLKGEHGTGRNVAPFVEMEWGSKAYDLMWELKALFDPGFVLNPGVILNRDPDAHKKFLKPSPLASELVDRCIECGFCESNCPSRDLSLTPRQRIASYKEIARLKGLGAERTAEETARLATFEKSYDYDGDATCAADGMCQEKCPVKINTGEMIKSLRSQAMDGDARASRAAEAVASHFGALNAAVPKLLNAVSLAHRVLGPKPLEWTSSWLNRLSGHAIPTWNPHMPKGASPLRLPEQQQASSSANAAASTATSSSTAIPRKVVYMPSCVTRMMGPSALDTETAPVHEKLMSLFGKAGYEVVLPEGVASQCCGMMFNSRGFKGAAATKGAELEAALLEASEGGKLPIVCDTSPCLSQIKASISDPRLRFSLYEPVEFVRHFLLDKLDFVPVRDTVAVHVPCSSKKMGIEDSFVKLAGLCAREVVPSGIPCCGMAGDRGMRYPELTASSLQHLQDNLKGCGATDGYSTSRTCEMSLSNHSGVNFRGLVYLLDEAARPKKQQPAAAASK